MTLPTTESATLNAPVRDQFETFLDEHRARLAATLTGLTEQEARASLVPSRTPAPIGRFWRYVPEERRIWCAGRRCVHLVLGHAQCAATPP